MQAAGRCALERYTHKMKQGKIVYLLGIIFPPWLQNLFLKWPACNRQNPIFRMSNLLKRSVECTLHKTTFRMCPLDKQSTNGLEHNIQIGISFKSAH